MAPQQSLEPSDERSAQLAKPRVVSAAPSQPDGLDPDATEPEAPDPDPPEPLEEISRPERQWRSIAEASTSSCLERLSATRARFTALSARDAPDTRGCGMPHGVILARGVSGMRYSPPLRVDCSFALRLGEVEAILAEEAKRRFGAEIARIGNVGAYVCRGVIGRLRGWSGGISEHSFGNAVDVTHLDLDSGKRISVLHHYQNEMKAVTAQRAMLHDVLRRVRRETGLRGLGPDFDASHRDHFHFDAGSRWWRWRRG